MIYTAGQAAKLLKISPKKMLEKLDSGEIPAYREGQDWKIPQGLLKAYIENRALRESAERKKLHSELKGE